MGRLLVHHYSLSSSLDSDVRQCPSNDTFLPLYVFPSLSFFLAGYRWSLLKMKTWKIRAMLTFAAAPVAPEAVLSNILRRFVAVVSVALYSYQQTCINGRFLLMLVTIWLKKYILVLHAGSSTGDTCPVTRFVLCSVHSGSNVSRPVSCIDCSSVKALFLWMLGVDCSASGTSWSWSWLHTVNWDYNRYTVFINWNDAWCRFHNWEWSDRLR